MYLPPPTESFPKASIAHVRRRMWPGIRYSVHIIRSSMRAVMGSLAMGELAPQAHGIGTHTGCDCRLLPMQMKGGCDESFPNRGDGPSRPILSRDLVGVVDQGLAELITCFGAWMWA